MSAPDPPATDERILQSYLQQRQQRQDTGMQYRTYMRWSGRALEIPVSVVVGLFLGRYIGGHLGHRDVGAALGIAFGVATAVRAVVRLVRAYQHEEADDA